MVSHRVSTYRRLSQVNPIYFFLLYIFLILAFAVAAWNLARDQHEQHYYAPYARLEPSSLEDKKRVEAALRRGINANLLRNERFNEGWHARGSELDVADLEMMNDDEVGFRIYMYARHLSNGQMFQAMEGSYLMRMRMRGRITGTDEDLYTCHHVTPPLPTPENARMHFDFGLLFYSENMDGSEIVHFCWRAEDEARFHRLLAGWKGDPSNLSGFFPRMLYFSSITMTTVGFGDIVPLSGRSRALAGIEAVVGWLVAGLFLNAVTWRASQRDER